MDETAFKALISGERRGLLSAAARCGLACLSPFYRFAVALRNGALDLGLKRTHRAAVPVVSIGNITTGGTGKTPLVAFVANWIRERDLRPAILSRGYRSLDDQASGGREPAGNGDRTNREADGSRSPANDEKLVLDKLCPGVPHVQNPDRVAGAKRAVEEHGAQVLVLDDGFQHRRLARDLDIVLIDSTNPFGYGRLLPRGLLREPLSALKRADCIVLTRVDLVSDEAAANITATIRKYARECPIVETAFRPSGLIGGSDRARPVGFEALHNENVVAFCGIGNPEAFRQSLAVCNLAAFKAYPDHHHYTSDDIENVTRLARDHNAAAIVTTLKDLVKIDRDDLASIPLYAIATQLEIETGEMAFAGLLEGLT